VKIPHEGGRLKLSGWIRTNHVVTGKSAAWHKAAFQLISYDENGRQIGHADVALVDGTQDWTYHERTVLLSRVVSAVTVQCHLWGEDASGTVWFDDVSLEFLGDPSSFSRRILDLEEATVSVDFGKVLGPLEAIWRGSDVGHMDRVATSTQTQAVEAAKEIGFCYVRMHNCIVSPRIYSEDDSGRPIYDWSLFDERVATVTDRGMVPIICLEGMPPEIAGREDGKDWMNPYPPKDDEGYRKWEALVEAVVRHCRETHGNAIHDWYFEVWNEPDASGYFQGTLGDYLKIYDHAARGALKGDPKIRIGGPAGADASWCLPFLSHCAKGTPVHFLSFHTYTVGVGVPVFDKLRLDLLEMESALAAVPSLKDLPILITEWGCASSRCPAHDRPYDAAFRLMATKIFMDHGVHLALPFCYGEGPHHCHEGFQGGLALFTKTTIPKPSFRAFELLSRMEGERVPCVSSNDPLGGIASIASDGNRAWVILFNLTEAFDRASYETMVRLEFHGLQKGPWLCFATEIAEGGCDPFVLWEEMGRPEILTKAQRASLIQKSQLPVSGPFRVENASIERVVPSSSILFFEFIRNEAKVEWLFDFGGEFIEGRETLYRPGRGGKEIPPEGDILLYNSSGRAEIVSIPGGERGLRLDGKGRLADGLQFRHKNAGGGSRILEAVIRLAGDAKEGYNELISINDVTRTGGNMILRLVRGCIPSVAARGGDDLYKYVFSDCPLTPGDRSHVAAVYDECLGGLFLYVDGEQVGGIPMDLKGGDMEPLRGVGMSNGGPTNGFTGIIEGAAESRFEGPFTPQLFQLFSAEGPSPQLPKRKREVRLELPRDVMDLPKLPSDRHPLWQPKDDDPYKYHHGPIISVWRDQFVVTWHACREGEDSAPYVGLVSFSEDLETWSDPAPFASKEHNERYERTMRDRCRISPQRGLHVNLAPRTLHMAEGRLYLWSLGCVSEKRKGYQQAEKWWQGRIFFTSDGARWEEIPPSELDALEIPCRTTASNHHFIPISKDRLMAAAMEGLSAGSQGPGSLLCAPITSDPTGLSGWHGGIVDTAMCPDVGEPGGWQGRDGTLHYAARQGQQIWHAFSADDGVSWSPLRPQFGFSDCPGNKEFGMLPDGRVWYVGNPVPGSRDQLVLALSEDGWIFDEAYLVRWEPLTQLYPGRAKGGTGYQYPSAVHHEGMLVIAYSVSRDFIEVSRVPLRE